jgi:hypothetical protein
MKQFDAPKKNSQRDSDAEINNLNPEEELECVDDEEEEENRKENGEDVDEEVFDGREEMTEADIDKLVQSVKPVQVVLTKVRLGFD